MNEGDPGQPGGGGGSPDTTAAAAATAQSRGDEGGGADAAPGGGAEGPPSGGPNARAQNGRGRDRRPPIKFICGERIKQSAEIRHFSRRPDDPVYRPLKIYTIDPSRHRQEGQTATINIPFEVIKKGPKGFRFEVISAGHGPFLDRDYQPVDLNEPNLLITNGHDPAPTDYVFHHQMVYAVAMSTYAVFRTALGRQIAWGFKGQRLKLLPHGIEGANAFYDRRNKALLFGWYRVEGGDDVDLPPGAIIYACLSHDIIVHELTHALLDGLRSRFQEATNPDVSAFHEAFADLVALLLRFSYSSVVRDIILRTNGDLRKDDDWLRFVFELAQGKGDRSLRAIDLDAKQKYDPDADMYTLGTVLVSAIIDAFVTIYTRKAAPVIRMASGRRQGLPPDAAMSGDLLDQLTHIASRLAGHLLTMCIRAIDYCPPVDITLGEYLRALITADRDLVPDDAWAYREALVDAFRKRHIFPGQVEALSEDALLWKPPDEPICIEKLHFEKLKFFDPSRAVDVKEAERRARRLGDIVCKPANLKFFGLADPSEPLEHRYDKIEPPVIESVRTSRRVGPDGQLSFDLVAEIVQVRKVSRPGEGECVFLGGATVILSSEGHVRYVIAKNIKNDARIKRQLEFMWKDDVGVSALQHDPSVRALQSEPSVDRAQTDPFADALQLGPSLNALQHGLHSLQDCRNQKVGDSRMRTAKTTGS